MVYPCFLYNFTVANYLHIIVTPIKDETQFVPRHLRKILEWFTFILGTLAGISMFLGTLINASSFYKEFMEKLIEGLAVLEFIWELVILFFSRRKLYQLVNTMKIKFSTADKELVEKCSREERRWMITLSSLLFAAFSMGILESKLKPSPERDAIRAQIYHYAYPENKFTINYWLPKFLGLDLSEPPTYYFYWVFISIMGFRIMMVGCFTLSVLGIFSIHLKGQFDYLLHHIDTLFDRKASTYDKRKFYINLHRGDYFLINPKNPYMLKFLIRGKKDQCKTEQYLFRKYVSIVEKLLNKSGGVIIKPRRADGHNSRTSELWADGPYWDETSDNFSGQTDRIDRFRHVYEEFFIKQIIQRHQFLLEFKQNVQELMSSASLTTCICFITIVALSIQTILISEFKVTYTFAFILLILHLQKLVSFSDSIEDCNQQVRQKFYFNSSWYTRSLATRTLVNVVLLRTVKPAHYSFHGDFLRFDKPLLLALMSNTYKFMNWIIYVNTK